MSEREGYIYRNLNASQDQLRDLLANDSTGWSWTPAYLYTCGAQRNDHLLRGEREYEEGRALRPGIEIRWRAIAAHSPQTASSAKRYDVLVFSAQEQSLPGFLPVPPDGAPWRIATTAIYLQHPLGTAAESGHDESCAATYFFAPDGSVQFVALLGPNSAQRGTE